MDTITALLNVYGEATIPIILLVAMSVAMAGKVVVAERSRRDFKQKLRELLGKGHSQAGADTALLLFFDRESQELFADVAIGFGSDFFVKSGLRRGSGVSGRVLETGQPVLVSDLYADDRFQEHPRREELQKLGVSSVVSVPIELAGRILGVMSLSSGKAGYFNESHIEALQPIAGEIAITIGHARIFEVTRTNWED